MATQKASKNTFQATTLKFEENSRTFQGLAQKFKDFSRTSLKFKDFSRLCEPCDHREGAVKSQEPSQCPKTAPYTISVSEHTKQDGREKRKTKRLCVTDVTGLLFAGDRKSTL